MANSKSWWRNFEPEIFDWSLVWVASPEERFSVGFQWFNLSICDFLTRASPMSRVGGGYACDAFVVDRVVVAGIPSNCNPSECFTRWMGSEEEGIEYWKQNRFSLRNYPVLLRKKLSFLDLRSAYPGLDSFFPNRNFFTTENWGFAWTLATVFSWKISIQLGEIEASGKINE